MGDTLSIFGQYGLAGLVIGALFISLWLLLRSINSINDAHNSRAESLAKAHAEERSEWLDAYKENTSVIHALLTVVTKIEAQSK